MASPFFDISHIQGSTVLVTGASGGIGAATGVLFARAGCNVVLAARRLDKLEEVKALAIQANEQGGTGQGGKIVAMALDMQDKAAVDVFVESLPDEVKDVDILVNNAGLVYGREHVGELNFDESEIMINTNVTGLFRLTNKIVPGMKARKRGHIIMLGSIAGREGYPGGSIYCATKHALSGFTEALLRELVDTPLRVTEIQPGMVETDFSVTRNRGDRKAASAVYQGLQPLVANDIAQEILWCAARPPHVQVAQLFVMPTAQASPTLAHRVSTK